MRQLLQKGKFLFLLNRSMNELRELVIELDRLYYYGRHDAIGQQMAKIRQYLTDTKKPAKVTGNVA